MIDSHLLLVCLLATSCHLLFWATSVANAFSIHNHALLPARRTPSTQTRPSNYYYYYYMGGYYNEPEQTIDQSQTHMIFGIRCVEILTRDAHGTLGVVGYQPVDDVDAVDYGPAMLQYWENSHQDWNHARIVELGASSTGLALAFTHRDGVASVVQCHFDSKRLMLLDHAADGLLSRNSRGLYRTKQLSFSDEDALPSPADVVIITMPEVLDRLPEVLVMEGSPRIVVPRALIPSSKLVGLDYRESNGIVEIKTSK